MLLITDIYDIFADVRHTAIDISESLAPIGVALASLFAVFALISSSAKIMSGKQTTAYEVLRPFIIIFCIAIIRPILTATDGLLSSFVTPIRQSTNVVVDSLTTRVATTAQIIQDFELEEGRGYKKRNVKNFLSEAEALRQIFREEGVPEQLSALTLVESDFQANAVSNKGAGGWYQFMPETAQELGLTVNETTDERTDLYKSARAAAKYLHNLKEIFGSWPLALAAYNAGGGTVQQAQRQAAMDGQAPETVSFAQVYQYLPEETRQYVPNFVTAAKAVDKYAKDGDASDYEAFTREWGFETRMASGGYRFWNAIVEYMTHYYGFALLARAAWAVIVALFNFLADNVYLVIDAWAELTLILLTFLAPFIFAFSIIPQYKGGIQKFFARYIQVSLWKIIGGAVAWASAVSRLGFYNIKLSADLQADTVTAMNEAGWMANGGFTTATGIATLFMMFQVPTIAGYIISSSGAGGIMNKMAAGARSLMNKPSAIAMNNASTAINAGIDERRLHRYRAIRDKNAATIKAGGVVSGWDQMRENRLRSVLMPAENAIVNRFRTPYMEKKYADLKYQLMNAEDRIHDGTISANEYNSIQQKFANFEQRYRQYMGKIEHPQTLTKKVSKQLKKYKSLRAELQRDFQNGTRAMTMDQYRTSLKELDVRFEKYIDLSHL